MNHYKRHHNVSYYFIHPIHTFHIIFAICMIVLKKIKFIFIHEKRSCCNKNKKYKEFALLKNKYVGKRCFIVCTGPSLLSTDLDALKSEFCFGMNSIFKIFGKTEWRPSYYCLIDPNVYKAIADDEDFQNIENALMPDTIIKEFKNLSLKKYIQFPFDNNEFAWHLLTNAPIKFTENAEILVYDAATVTYTLMQIAVFMGFKEIYLLGCDCNYSGEKQHFSEYGVNVTNYYSETEDQLISAYQAARQYADAHGIKIYNATRGGKLEVFERVDFDRLF